jgi:citronellol/citronellal dehydrogenase
MRHRSIFAPGLFAGRLVIVTGGGSAIGRCAAHELASLGAHVVIVGRKARQLAAVAKEITGDGGRATTCPCDIRDERAVSAMVEHTVTRYGPVHGLVNNAGGRHSAAQLEAIGQKEFQAILRTHLVGGFLVAREVYRQSMRATGGAIVNVIADMWGGMPGMAHYGAARAAMDNLTQSAAVEWAAAGVRVNAVAPGWIETHGPEGVAAANTPDPGLAETVPLGRFGTEAEVSAAICFLLSDAAAFVTGATLRVDGGASQNTRVRPLAPARNVTRFDGFHRARGPRPPDED